MLIRFENCLAIVLGVMLVIEIRDCVGIRMALEDSVSIYELVIVVWKIVFKQHSTVILVFFYLFP